MDLASRTTACRVLVTSLLALSLQTAHAGLIGADQAAGPAPSPERVLVLGTLDRAEVIAQLQAAGVDPLAARERVQAMSEREVQAMAHDIQASPAGGMSNAGWVALVLIAALVWYYAIRK